GAIGCGVHPISGGKAPMKRRRSRRSKSGERFVLFPAWVLTHEDWRRTHPDARAIIIDMTLRWQGRIPEFNNNGRMATAVVRRKRSVSPKARRQSIWPS